jgi:hypothetical protein
MVGLKDQFSGELGMRQNVWARSSAGGFGGMISPLPLMLKVFAKVLCLYFLLLRQLH